VNSTRGARPLAGRRVLVTRPRAQADVLVQQLEAAGALVVVAPTVTIVPPADSGPLLNAAARAGEYDWIVFASANAVDALLGALGDRAGQLRNVAAVGSRTAERLEASAITPAVVPDEFTAEALVKALAAHSSLKEARVLLPRSEIGRDTIAEGLRAAGAHVTDVVAYRTVAEMPAGDAADVNGLLSRHELDAVTFTSGSAVRNFVQLHGAETVDLLRRVVVAVIGPVTAGVARELKIEVHVQPSTYTTAAMVEALAEYFSTRPA
jgi:uroporphyrinogen III methyltransferase/synthase